LSLFARRPSSADVERFLAHQAGGPYSYPSVGATRGRPPDGYVVDHNRIRLGDGEPTFTRAVAALRRWEMFNIGWVTLYSPSTPIEAGRAVAILVRVFGVWSLNASRIVYVLDEEDEVRRFGFAYGTLADHAESGEERFSVEWRRSDDSVWYDLFAFSRPRHPLARIGRPFSRALQRRFARDSLKAMARAARLG
jgi:uncharacterized protein (UPF0548 family)